jgi:hypothetical protein
MNMKPSTTIAFGALLLTVAIAPGASAQSPACQSAQFSDSVLQRFPRAREACLDVITRNGEQYAVFKADLLRVSGTTARIRAKLPGGARAPAQSIRFDPQRRVLVNGKPLHPSQLAVGQELTAYVKVTEPAATLATADDGALTTQPLEDAEPERVASAEMPGTASPLPLFGAGGSLLLAIGAALAFWRNRARFSG